MGNVTILSGDHVGPPVRVLGRMFVVAAMLALASGARGREVPHVVFVFGEGEYRSEVTMPALAQRLEAAWGWRTTVLHDRALHAGDDNHVAGLETLDSADLVVLYLRFRRWPREDLEALGRYVGRGGPIVAFRTSTHAFAYDKSDPRRAWNDFGALVLGAPWIRHYGHGSSTNAAVVGRGGDDGILDGVPDEFHVRSWTYHVRPDHPGADARVLVRGTPVLPGGEAAGLDAINPVAWTRTTEFGGRVFMTTMGHPEDFQVEAFRRLVGNGIHWALDRPIPKEALDDFPAVLHPDDDDRPDEPWLRMDYGPFLSTAVGLGEGIAPVHKGIVVRLRTLDGDPTNLHAVFDTDLLAWRCVWVGELALKGIVFDGPHGTFPEIVGTPLFRLNATAGVGTRAEPPFVDPREEPFGPIPTELGRWSGLHLDGDDVVLSYTVGDGRHRVLERVWAQAHDGGHAFVREVTVQTAGEGAGPVLRSIGASDGEAMAATRGSEGVEIIGRGAAVRVPANGTVRIAIAEAGTGDAPVPAGARVGVQEAITRARPRWGSPLTTRGLIDDPLDADDVARRFVRAAGAAPEAFDLVDAAGGRLELFRDGVAVEAGPARGAVIVRSAPRLDARAWGEQDQLGWWPSDTGHGEFERNGFTGELDLRLDAVTWRRGVAGRALDFDGTAAAWFEGTVDLGAHDLTVGAWIHTTADGTVFAVAPVEGDWVPDGATLFVRDGRLSFDVGWVGVVAGGPQIADGAWHHVAATWHHQSGEVRLFVDGEPVASGSLPLSDDGDQSEFGARFGWTNDNFPAVSRFSGFMDGPILLRRALADEAIGELAAMTGEPLIDGTIVQGAGADQADAEIAIVGGPAGRVARLRLGRADADGVFEVRQARGPRSVVMAWAAEATNEPVGVDRPFRIDRLTWPDDNPYGSWLRFGDFGFLPSPDGNPTRGVITTWSGDVWEVDGLDEDLDELRWARVATGLSQPLGVAVHNGETLILGRDQITRLQDNNADGETDYYENFSNLTRNSEHFHEPASGLLVTPEGDLLYHKAARHAKHALHDHHGTIVRVSADGTENEVVARGFRAPIGLTRLPDGSLLGSDQEGHWTPANRINLIRPSADRPLFFGNGWGARPDVRERIEKNGELVHPAWEDQTGVTPPLCWLHPTFDRSPSSQVLADHPAWGPLEGSILGLSYGLGEVYLVLRDDVPLSDGSLIAQGGVVKLGIRLPTGLLAGRIHPATGDLYVCGLFGWSSDQTAPGGFYRIRPRPDAWERSLNVPRRIRALADGLELAFLGPLDPAASADPANWDISAWNYKRDADYGSSMYDLEGQVDARTTWTVERASLGPDGRTVRLKIEGFRPAMQVHVAWSIRDASGLPLAHEAHLTVHALHGAAQR